MKTWKARDAGARFSEFLDTCLKDGPHLVTRRGAELAVLVPVAEWRRLVDCPSLKDLLLTDFARGDLNVPPRGGRKRGKTG